MPIVVGSSATLLVTVPLGIAHASAGDVTPTLICLVAIFIACLALLVGIARGIH